MKCIYEESVIYLALEQMTAENLLPKTHNGQIKNLAKLAMTLFLGGIQMVA